MLGRLTRRSVRTGLAVLLAVPAVLGITGVVYAVRLYTSASALINSARVIRTTADAEREITAWRKREGNDFWVESSEVREKTYEAQIGNPAIARLGLVELMGVTLEVTLHDGQLRRVTVTEWNGYFPLASVWIQEWFDSDLPNRFLVSRTDLPSKAAVVFPSSLRADQRAKVFAVKTQCLVRLSPCKTAADILPGVWQLDSGVSPD